MADEVDRLKTAIDDDGIAEAELLGEVLDEQIAGLAGHIKKRNDIIQCQKQEIERLRRKIINLGGDPDA